MLKRLLYRSGDALFPKFAQRFWRHRIRGQVRCLLYHRVGEVGEFPFIDAYGAPVISVSDLKRDVLCLQTNGARFLTFADLREGRFPATDEFGVVLSFDDGTRDVYEKGLPLLESLGVRGVVFQVSSFIDATKPIWEHLLYRLWWEGQTRSNLRLAMGKRYPGKSFPDGAEGINLLRDWPDVPMLEDAMRDVVGHGVDFDEDAFAKVNYPAAHEVRRAAAAGHEIGSHGHDHLMRSALDSDGFEKQLEASRFELESVVGDQVLAFSHPFNCHVSSDRELLARHYSQAATVEAAPIFRNSDPLALARFNWPGKFKNDFRWRRWLWTGG